MLYGFLNIFYPPLRKEVYVFISFTEIEVRRLGSSNTNSLCDGHAIQNFWALIFLFKIISLDQKLYKKNPTTLRVWFAPLGEGNVQN